MLGSQRSFVLVAAVSGVFFSAFIAARSSYKGKLKNIVGRIFDRLLSRIFDNVKTLLFC